MKIALFGGTFNPVHTGHLLMAEAARDHFDLDQVVFLPTGLPPHKKNPSISVAHRWAMLRLALKGNPAFHLNDWEIRQRRIVYTYETLEHFHRLWPRHTQHFLIGSDSLAQLPLWRQGVSLLKACSFIIVERPGAAWSDIPSALRRKVRRVDSDPVPFSSHTIRRLVHEGKSIRYQVPEAVERYIHRHRLYRAAD